MVARIGGDEFAAIIITKPESKTPQIIAKRILQDAKNLITVGDLNVPLSMSIGIASYPDDGSNMDEVIKKADEALYSVKRAGRNNYAIYNKSFDYR